MLRLFRTWLPWRSQALPPTSLESCGIDLCWWSSHSGARSRVGHGVRARTTLFRRRTRVLAVGGGAVRSTCAGSGTNGVLAAGTTVAKGALSGAILGSVSVPAASARVDSDRHAAVRWDGWKLTSTSRLRLGGRRPPARGLRRAETTGTAGRIGGYSPMPRSTRDSPVIAAGASTPSSASIVGAMSQSDPFSRTCFPPASPSGVR